VGRRSPNTVVLFVHKGARDTWANISLALARGLSEAGVPRVYLARLTERPQLEGELPEGTLLEELPARHSYSAPRSLSRFLRATRPDLTISTPSFVNAAAVIAWLLAGKMGAFVAWEQNSLSFKSLVEHRDELRMRMVPFLARALYPRASGVTAVSHGVLDDVNAVVRGRVEVARQAVIPDPIDVDKCRALSREELTDPWFEEDVPVLLSVSRLAMQKDVPTLIRALDLVRRRRPVRLVILGGGPEEQRVRRLIGNLGLDGHVRLVGNEHNPYRYMSRATCLVLSSQEEGFGLVVPEALACGLPVIATDCAGPSETLRSVGLGTLVPIGDADALAEGILFVLSTIEARRREVQAADLSQFTPRAVAERWIDFYRRVAM
jgi:glycosyltransferase involved in cell wall biosynthesis